VISTLISECKKIVNEDITEEELNRVKDYMSGSFILGLETSDSRAEYCAINQILKGSIDTPQTEIDKIRKVTVEDIKKVARDIFVDEKLNMAIIGPYKDEARFAKLLTFK
jgi:predicted Zn-dependent peptidase